MHEDSAQILPNQGIQGIQGIQGLRRDRTRWAAALRMRWTARRFTSAQIIGVARLLSPPLAGVPTDTTADQCPQEIVTCRIVTPGEPLILG
jgi:hypothetical protein